MSNPDVRAELRENIKNAIWGRHKTIRRRILDELFLDSTADDILALTDDANSSPQAKEIEAHPDDIAVDRFASAMKAKLASARDKGRGGWDDPARCCVEVVRKMLHEHIAKGDPVDVANFCMMLQHYGASTALPSWDGERKVYRHKQEMLLTSSSERAALSEQKS